MTFLIVDDNLINLKLLTAMLETEGISAVTSTNGREALMKLEHFPVDAIVSDILMPEMDGYTLCMKVHKDSRFSSLPFIFLTATYTSPSDENFARLLGADDFLTKPVSVKKLLDSIDHARKHVLHKEKNPANFSEEEILKQYGNRLIEKLENKNTELERTAMELRTANEQLQNLFRNLDEMFFSYDLTTNTMLNVSASCEKIYGYTAEQFLENPFLWKEMIHPNDKEHLTVSYLALNSGRIINDVYRIIHRSGEIRWIDLKIRADVDSSGVMRRIDGIISDITKNKLAKESLQESMENYRGLFENARDAIFTLSASGIFRT